MSTATKAPDIDAVRAAQRKADEVAAAFTAAEEAKQRRITQALADEAEWRMNEHRKNLATARTKAVDRLKELIAQNAPHHELFAAYVDARAKSAAFVIGARDAAGVADERLGIRATTHGQQVSRPRPQQDSFAMQRPTFDAVLQAVVEAAVKAAVIADGEFIRDRETRAVAAAEKATG